MPGTLVIVVSVLTLLVAACGDPPRVATPVPERLSLSAAAGSTGPRLARGPSGDVILSWMEPAIAGGVLRYSHFRDGSWQSPRRVVFEPAMFVNWADLPSVTSLRDDHLAAHWLVKRPGGPYAYDIAFARSIDGGETWSDSVSPHNDATLTQHGFVSAYPHGEHVGLIWLDGRRTGDDGEEYSIERGMTLRAVAITDGAQLVDEQEIDGLVCSCCPTDTVVSASGPVAVYRDRSDAEIRDIRLAYLRDGRWQPGSLVAEDDWEITACPVNGPKLAAHADNVAVAWFTAPNDQPSVKAAFSSDAGQSFSTPVIISNSQAQGQVGIADLGNRGFAISWLERGDGPALTLVVRRITLAGGIGNSLVVTDSVAPFSTPQLARHDDRLLFAWTESVAGRRQVTSAALPAHALP